MVNSMSHSSLLSTFASRTSRIVHSLITIFIVIMIRLDIHDTLASFLKPSSTPSSHAFIHTLDPRVLGVKMRWIWKGKKPYPDKSAHANYHHHPANRR